MNTQYREDLKVWAISTDSEHILHHKGSDDYATIRKAITANPEDWEEIAIEDIPPYTIAEYNAKVAELIHERYDADKEMSLINNMMEAEPTEAHKAEYSAYQAYRAECKLKAKDPSLYVKETPDTENETESAEG